MVKLLNRVLPEAKLPLEICRGNVKQRYKLAADYNDRFVKMMDKYSHSKRILDVDIYKKCLDETLFPHRINYEITRQEDFWAGTLEPVYDVVMRDNTNNSAFINNTGFKIYFKLDDSGKYILNKHIAVHETRHLFDHICNPKTNNLKCNEEFNSIADIDKFCYEINDMTFRNKGLISPYEKSFLESYKFKLCDNLEKLHPYLQIEVLQKIRYSLQTEINAYSDEIKYLKSGGVINRLKNIVNIYLYKEFLNKQMRFQDKLEIVNGILKNIMLKERSNIK